MSEPIKAGDLVMVVRGHACNLGRVWTVVSIGTAAPTQRCMVCSAEWASTHHLFAFVKNRIGYCIDRLKRIDPPAQPETVEHAEESFI